MTNTVLIQDHTYSDGTSDEGLGYRFLANNGHRLYFIKLISDIVTTANDAVIAGDLAAQNATEKLKGSSTSSLTIAIGSTSFVVAESLRAWTVGSSLKLTSDANVLNYMIGTVTSYTGSSISISIDTVGGSGSFSDWRIGVNPTAVSGMANIIEDLSPQLGGNLDLNSYDIPVSPSVLALVNSIKSLVTDTSPQLGGNLDLNSWDIPVSNSVQAAIDSSTGMGSLLEDSTPQLGGDLDTNGKSFNSSCYRQIPDALPGTGSTHSLDFSAGDMQRVTCPATGTLTLAVSNMVVGKVCCFVLELVNGGNCTITHDATWLFQNGVAPTYTVAGVDRIIIIKDRSNIISYSVQSSDSKVLI